MSKERTRRYRERLNQDETRREEILRERRRKYHEKKAKGEIQPQNINCLPKQKREKLHEQWRKTKARSRKREKDLAAILNMIDLPIQTVTVMAEHSPQSALTKVDVKVEGDGVTVSSGAGATALPPGDDLDANACTASPSSQEDCSIETCGIDGAALPHTYATVDKRNTPHRQETVE
ncbi:hypothetical protein MATL_G00048200 [Megalops atlanticus]|uniref:Uncharacterized protein n=1 Tax=Megalops atlanticus TaxID=7932 RepID=A0A9D3Q9Z0_MEGAT|nr:hypothetical protein MATL_G00048200 [Megalops atlanticus]